ncbi:MAG TPA: hypothetical protein VFP48_07980 [Steroidobacteraceae bacterium]|nr:hypothetical protein [Steroidobacteraceae bacterium]
MWKSHRLLLALLLLTGCQREPQSNGDTGVRNGEIDAAGAVSTAPIVTDPPTTSQASLSTPLTPRGEIDWSPLQLETASVGLSCNLDYQRSEDVPLTDFTKEGLHQALMPCSVPGLLRLRFRGTIDRKFSAVVERITATADELDIGKRVLDLDSTGGQVEDAIRTGDFIAESHWTIWVREGSVCHSACVLILGAGDTRMIAGRVGIHRIIRMSSTASTRAELNAELNAVYQRVRGYLERNGVSVAVADLMMAVPNRRLRLLTGEELRLYGLDGVNPVQDDLDRLRLMRKCGEDFVRRRDAFLRSFERRCQAEDDGLGALNECGLELRTRFGFPDSACPAESPLSEFDAAVVANPPVRTEKTGQPDGTEETAETDETESGQLTPDAGPTGSSEAPS